MKNKSVLICDRDIAFLGVAKLMLQQAGYTVETLHDCSNIISALHKLRPDIIFADVRFYDGGSEEMMRVLRTDPGTKSIPVIVCSSEDARDIAMRSGATGYLKKPFTVQELEMVIHASLN